MNRGAKFLFIIIATAIAVSCGSPGEPLPPSLEIPRQITDLRVARKGNAVTLTWTMPTLTTEGRTITQPGNVEVCRSLAEMQKCEAPIARIPFKKNARNSSASRTESYVDMLASPDTLGNPTANFYYAVSAVNSYSKNAGPSNQVQVPAAPALPPPSGLTAQVTGDGIRLNWQPVTSSSPTQGLHFVYRVYRRESGAKAEVVAGEIPVGDSSPTLLDHSFGWEKTYEYRVAIVTQGSHGGLRPCGDEGILASADCATAFSVEGDDSPAVQVVAHDVFPPATPTGLQAVFSGPGQKPFIDLVWSANTEPDLAGYNIYRHEEGLPARKVNFVLVNTPVFRDGTARLCVTYFYSVSAVDVRGNESPRSEEAKQGILCEQ